MGVNCWVSRVDREHLPCLALHWSCEFRPFGVLILLVLTAYDTQNIKEHLLGPMAQTTAIEWLAKIRIMGPEPIPELHLTCS